MLTAVYRFVCSADERCGRAFADLQSRTQSWLVSGRITCRLEASCFFVQNCVKVFYVVTIVKGDGCLYLLYCGDGGVIRFTIYH